MALDKSVSVYPASEWKRYSADDSHRYIVGGRQVLSSVLSWNAPDDEIKSEGLESHYIDNHIEDKGEPSS